MDNPWVVWLTLGLAGIAALGVIVGAGLGVYSWAADHWGRFHLRWLDPLIPDGDIDPDDEKKSRLIALLPGSFVLRFSLRPNISINHVTHFTFSAFNNQRYPRRLGMASIGSRVSPMEITATRLRRRQGTEFGAWEDIPPPVAGDLSTQLVYKVPFTRGRRQVFEVEYQVQESMGKWNGILGVQLTYEANGNNEGANINSKAFVRNPTAPRRPLTFWCRPLMNAKQIPQPSPDTVDSRPPTGE